VQSGICRLSYPPTVRVLQARKQRPRSVSPESLGVDLAESSARLEAVSAPRRERETEIIRGTPEEIAGALMDRIDEALAPS
jgi:electron transfer flavoprotein alpha/beta subunit